MFFISVPGFWFGPNHFQDTALIFHRRNAAERDGTEPVLGLNHGTGLVNVMRFRVQSGELIVPLGETVVHELAHQRVGGHLNWGTDARWLREGLAELVEEAQYPLEPDGLDSMMRQYVESQAGESSATGPSRPSPPP